MNLGISTPQNRLLTAYLSNNYANSLEGEDRKADVLKKMEKAVASMPAFINEAWKKN